MLKQGGKEVKEHNQFIEVQKFVACFEIIHYKFPVIWLMKLFFDPLWTVLERRQNLE